MLVNVYRRWRLGLTLCTSVYICLCACTHLSTCRQWQRQWFNDFASVSLKFVNNKQKLLRIYINLKKIHTRASACKCLQTTRILRCFISLVIFFHPLCCYNGWCEIKRKRELKTKEYIFGLVIITSLTSLIRSHKCARENMHFHFFYYFWWSCVQLALLLPLLYPIKKGKQRERVRVRAKEWDKKWVKKKWGVKEERILKTY